MPSNKSGVALLLEAPELDTTLYTGGVRIAAPYMKPLAHVLVNAAPSDSTTAQKKQLAIVVEIAEHGDGVLDERQTAVTAIRPAFMNFTNAQGGLYDSLVAKARIPESLSDVGPRASAVVELVYPNGTAFVKRDAHGAWSEGDRLIHFIHDHKLEKEIGALVGPEALAAAKQATVELGEALGVGSKRRETPGTTDLQSTMSRFSSEVGRYARMLSGDVDFANPASVERFRKAVAEPIDTFRSRRAPVDTAANDTTGAPETPPMSAGEVSAAAASSVGTIGAPDPESGNGGK